MDLTGVVEQYEKDGYAIIRGAVDADLIAEAREHVEWLQHRYPELRPEELHHPLIRNDAFWVRLATDDRFLDIAESIIGPNLACLTAHYICKPPFDGQAVLWHQDGAYWKLDPMEALTVWLAVDPSTPENGCLKVIPGSHVEPLREHKVRHDVPNMLASETDGEVVSRWAEERGLVDVVLEPGDVSIHHPHILHCSEPNTSSIRRCGLDLGYIPTTTAVTNEGLYLDALLVRGEPVPGVNNYRPWPEYDAAETIPFRGHETWNEKVTELNARMGFVDDMNGETPLEITQRMVRRLHEGTVKQ